VQHAQEGCKTRRVASRQRCHHMLCFRFDWQGHHGRESTEDTEIATTITMMMMNRLLRAASRSRRPEALSLSCSSGPGTEGSNRIQRSFEGSASVCAPYGACNAAASDPAWLPEPGPTALRTPQPAHRAHQPTSARRKRFLCLDKREALAVTGPSGRLNSSSKGLSPHQCSITNGTAQCGGRSTAPVLTAGLCKRWVRR
jgi:hypothetical protein